jgi:hypothetical protein
MIASQPVRSPHCPSPALSGQMRGPGDCIRSRGRRVASAHPLCLGRGGMEPHGQAQARGWAKQENAHLNLQNEHKCC